MELRNELDLFAYIMNCKSFPGVETRHKDVDILIVRQNTEGEYAMLEHEVCIPMTGIEVHLIIKSCHQVAKRLANFYSITKRMFQELLRA